MATKKSKMAPTLSQINPCPPDQLTGEQFRAVLARPDFSNIELENSWTNVDPSIFHGMLLSVSIYNNETKNIYVHGSAALASYNYCLCATHVIEEHVVGFERGELTIFLTGYYRNKIVMWQATQVCAIKGYDIAMVAIEPRFKPVDVGVVACTDLAFEMPKVGDSIVIAGTIAKEPTYSMNDNSENPPSLETRFCRGRVVDVYPDGRDTQQIPMPAFSINTPAWGGMSGGPAFNEQGLHF